MKFPENVGRLENIIKRGVTDPAHAAFLWVGAGLSIPAGYPGWGQLIERFRDASVESLNDVSDPLEAIDAFVRVNGKGLLNQQLLELFDQKQPLLCHQELVQLPWKGIVTTNYDELLEDALKQVKKAYVKVTLEQNLDLVTGDRLPVYKVHGDLASFRDVILSGESYRTFRERHPLLKADLESLLRKHSLVLFGCSMTDPRLLDWLRAMSADDREMLMPSCAVLTKAGWNRVPEEDRTLLESGNIKPILLQDYGDIPELITHLLYTISPPKTEGFRFDLAFTSDEHNQWRIMSNGVERVVDVPWKESNAFGIALKEFVDLTRTSVNDNQLGALHTHAARLGDDLGQALLSADVWEPIRQAFAQSGPQPMTIASDDPLILSLPWELMRQDRTYVVREGIIDLIRTTSSSAPDPATLTMPDRPILKLVVNVSAPASSNQLDYEAESYRLAKALHEHSEVVFTELGTVADLVSTVVARKPTGVHFSGHGEPGALEFEDDEGQSNTVTIERLIHQIRQEEGHLPHLFYLASCHGNTAANLDAERPGTTMSSAHLHREGVTEVIGYYGPIADVLSTLAEETFYRSLAEGRTTRFAVRRARLALVKSPEVDGNSTHRTEAEVATMQVRQHPFAWAQLVYYHRGPEHPLSLPLPQRYAQSQEVHLQRTFEGTDQRQILSTGFIGRRQELHQFRRAVRRGQRIFVFQGLGGIGKSTLAFQALPILTRNGKYPALTIWCQELEHEENLPRALTNQLSETAQTHFGDQWIGVVQAADQKLEATEPQRFEFFLRTMVESVPHLVLYLDNLESLLGGPDDDDSEAFGEWRHADLNAIWQVLKTHSGDKLSVVASCRYRHAAFEAHTLHIRDMNPASIFRMMGWFEGLRQLSLPSRAKLVERLHGHPRAVAFLDDLVRNALTTWTSRCGEWVTPRTPEAIRKEWEDLIASALPEAEAQLRSNLLLDAIWYRVLDDRCRRMLFRMTLLRRPWDWALMMQLGDADEAVEWREATAGKLRATSLVGEVQERREDRWVRLFQVHPATARFIAQQMETAEAASLAQATYLRMGTYLEDVAKTSHDLRDRMDAGHYLFSCGEFDRACELLGSASEWLQNRAMVRLGLNILEPFEAIAKHMSPEHEEKLLGTLGSGYYRLGQVNQAIRYYERALVISCEIGDRQGEGAQLGNLGNAYRALGEMDKAIKYVEQALIISREIGDRQGEITRLGNLGIAYHVIGEMDKAIEYVEQALIISRETGNRQSEGGLLGTLGLVYRDLGEMDKAIVQYEQALVISRETGDRQGEGAQLSNLGNAYRALGEVQKAIGYHEQTLIISRETGDRRGEGTRLGNLGNAYLTLGEVEKAIEYLEQALIISREIGDRLGVGYRLANLGSAYEQLGDVEKAKALWQKALTKLIPGTSPYTQVEGWLQTGA
ncbi:tetratricopeptide repeat protein [Candidatus Entotheonella palauensis]|nr:tetratricopeptide repeat protein [Candidatus Entotheonella palauensis]